MLRYSKWGRYIENCNDMRRAVSDARFRSEVFKINAKPTQLSPAYTSSVTVHTYKRAMLKGAVSEKPSVVFHETSRLGMFYS